MRQNRKVSRRRSVIGMHVMHAGAVLVMLVVMVIFNLLASSSCNRLKKSIGEKDLLIRERKAELDRAHARWEATKSTDNLYRALGRHGLVMNYPNANQVIRIDGRGELIPGQRSVAFVRQRQQGLATAALATTMRRARN